MSFVYINVVFHEWFLKFSANLTTTAVYLCTFILRRKNTRRTTMKNLENCFYCFYFVSTIIYVHTEFEF